MKRHIVVSVKGVELVNILLEEINDDEEEAEPNMSVSSGLIESGEKTVGFGTPWSAEFYDDEA